MSTCRRRPLYHKTHHSDKASTGQDNPIGPPTNEDKCVTLDLAEPKYKPTTSTKISVQFLILGSLLILTFCGNFPSLDAELTRKTYSIWDLTPDELTNLFEKEQALQKRKRNIDLFLRRRTRKSAEILPSDEIGTEDRVSNTQNNLGNMD